MQIIHIFKKVGVNLSLASEAGKKKDWHYSYILTSVENDIITNISLAKFLINIRRP